MHLRWTLALTLAACGSNAGVNGGAADARVADAPLATIDAGAPSARGVIFINEVLVSNNGGCKDEAGELDDWIELYNAGGTAFALGGYSVTDNPSDRQKGVLPAGVSVPAHGYLLLWADDGSAQGPNHVDFKLSAEGESVTLYDPAGVVVDEVTWGVTQSDASWARATDGAGPFELCGLPTCGAANTASCAPPPDAGPPDAPPVLTGPLFINEVMPSNSKSCPDDKGDPGDDWFELYNAGDAPIDLGGYTVSDDPDEPGKTVLSAGLTVPAHGYLTLWADEQLGQGPRHVDFKLGASGEQIVLHDAQGRLVDLMSWTNAEADESFARLPDGTGAFAECETPSCGAANACRED